MAAFWCDGELVVVETEDGERYLGLAELREDGRVAIRNGYRGRPTVIAYDDIDSIKLAAGHPDVTEVPHA